MEEKVAGKKSVTFARGQNLCRVYYLANSSDNAQAQREARDGRFWASDGFRFRQRILDASVIITPVLLSKLSITVNQGESFPDYTTSLVK